MSNWTQLGSTLVGEKTTDNFGNAVAISADGTLIAVGAVQNDGAIVTNSDNKGHVRVFKWNGTAWNQLGGDIDGTATNDRSGTSVAITETATYGICLAIGAPQNDGTTDINADNRGQVRTFIYNPGTLSWNLEFTYIGDASGNRSGRSVALSSDGNVLAIGCNLSDASGVDSGHVIVLKRNSGNWQQRGSIIKGLNVGAQAGVSVSLSSDGNIVAVGAPGYNNGIGYVQVMEWNTTDWGQKGSLFVGNSVTEYRFPGPNIEHGSAYGTAVSLSSNGLVLAFGAQYDSTVNLDNGRAYIYEWTAGAWALRGSPLEGAGLGDQFGESASLSADGKVVAVGSRYNDVGANNNIGEVRVWYWSDAQWTQLGSDLNGQAAGNFFGVSTALSSDGSVLVVGEIGATSFTGNVRIFTYPTPIPCLPAGTRVLTAAGYKAVEELAQDDLIVTSEGQAVPFKVYTTDVAITTEKNAPYLIPARTFGKFPVKDLMLSPNHAFQSRPGVWQIPKYAAMMNPAIKQVDIGKSVTYYHIETPDYFKDNLMVEGTPVESFAHKQLRKGEIVYSYSARYNGFIRSQAARQSQSQDQARLIKS